MPELENTRKEIDAIDREMARLFELRMQASEEVARIKAEKGIPVYNAEREEIIKKQNVSFLHNEALVPYYTEFMQNVMDISKKYQYRIMEGASADFSVNGRAVLHVSLNDHSYDITFAHGALYRAKEIFHLNRRAFIITDSGVPEEYVNSVLKQCTNGYVFTVPQGENSKSIAQFEKALSEMLRLGFSRKDCVIAVGGGVVGDLAGFTAASYMRGIDFYNIPTTVLSQVDSSIGGKTAVNLNGIKNAVGAFYQPKAVIIDPDVLQTLPPRQLANGLAEALKMSLTSDAALFDIFENEDVLAHLDEIILRSVQIKKEVVEQDEKEQGLRRILNFGHTIGHAIESEEHLNGLYHGECVALGMLPMCDEALRPRVKRALEKIGLPLELKINEARVMEALIHDKKSDHSGINVIFVKTPGEYISRILQPEDFPALLQLISKR